MILIRKFNDRYEIHYDRAEACYSIVKSLDFAEIACTAHIKNKFPNVYKVLYINIPLTNIRLPIIINNKNSKL